MVITPKFFKKTFYILPAILFVLFAFGVISARANSTKASLPFSQDWTDATLITVNDNWGNVPSIIGYLGDNAASADVDVDPRTILSDTSVTVDVIANQSNTALVNGGVAEFSGIADPTIALQGSATADAPYIKIFLDTTDAGQIQVSYDVRDIDLNDDAVQQVALHYRVGSSGDFTNIPAGYIPDATDASNTKVTTVNITLPAAADNQSHIELRVMTTNASSYDEWVGIDNIAITAGDFAPTGISLAPDSVLENQPVGTSVGTLTASDPDPTDTHTFLLVASALCPNNGADNSSFTLDGSAIKTNVKFDYETKPTYFVCAQATDNYGLSKIQEIEIEILDVLDETPPAVLTSNPLNNSVLLASPAHITVEFSEDVKHDSSVGAADNPVNFLFVEAGADSLIETDSCKLGAALTDAKIHINSASYQNSGGAYISTIMVNNGAALSPGKYLLLVCGTTSIEDLSGNKIGGGATDARIYFTISAALTASNSMPATGFPVGYQTQLAAQPDHKTYADFSDLRLEIPALKISTPIVGVPLTETGWDVNWLGANAGWLNQTAFPTWAGNSVITGHVWDALNKPGIFHQLKELRYGDFVKIHAFGQTYIYEARETKQIAPNDFSSAFKHEDKSWLTLVTCEDYQPLLQTYNYRRMVRAVLLGIVSDE